DVARLAAGERAGHALEQAHGAQIHIQIEPAAEVDEQSPHRDVVGHERRIADRAEVHRVELAQDIGRIVRTHLAVRLVPVAAPRELFPRELDAMARAHCFQHANAFGNDFAPDAVARDDCYAMFFHGGQYIESAMKFAAFETSSEWCSVALAVDGEIAAIERRAGHRHSELALPMFEQLLGNFGLTVAQLDAIAFGAGPGSFTGLRIACGLPQGLAIARALPVIGMPPLDAVARETGGTR